MPFDPLCKKCNQPQSSHSWEWDDWGYQVCANDARFESTYFSPTCKHCGLDETLHTEQFDDEGDYFICKDSTPFEEARPDLDD